MLILQIPFSSLKEEFLELTTEDETLEIIRSCDHFPVEKILVYLHEFILFFVRDRSDDQKNFGLVN